VTEVEPRPTSQLLGGVRVIDTTDGRGEGCGRFLADLGADVIRVEARPEPRRLAFQPGVSDVDLTRVIHRAGKRSLLLDFTAKEDCGRFLDLLAGADIWIDSGSSRLGDDTGVDPVEMHRRFSHLVVLCITDFGHTGPIRDWVATDWVLMALSGMLSRSGVPGRAPFMPPGDLADESTAIQAAWSALLAYWQRLQTGVGDVLDFSRHDATAQMLDPAFGAIGTAAAQTVAPVFNRGRPESLLYPTFRCVDGNVRIVILAARQWRGMWEWLGHPDEFADPKFEHARERYQVASSLYPRIAELFAGQTAADLVAEGQRRGVPIAPVFSPRDVLDSPHFRERRSFVEVELSGVPARMPSGHLIIDGERAGPRFPAPKADMSVRAAECTMPVSPPPVAQVGQPPLRGIRVLDLGVIVMGGEAGRLFADQGADVIKVENRYFPDGARMMGMTARFAAAHRNKRSIGVNLRDARGLEILKRLVAESDVLLSNFKPGTLDSLGIGPTELQRINPRLVVATSSAMGESGPWKYWMGYGPLVRCVSGLTFLWRDPELPEGFGDATTVYPDHLVARVVVTAALAALIRRRTDGLGARIESAQAESILMGLGPQYLRESMIPGSSRPLTANEFHAPWGIYPCSGDDEWCVVTVRGDEDWEALVKVVGYPSWTADPDLATADGRVLARYRLDEDLAAWTSSRTPDEVAAVLQAGGVPSAPMRRVDELLDDQQLRARDFFSGFEQPGVSGQVISERGPCRAFNLPDPILRPAPFYGQHTREVCMDILGMASSTIDELISAGVLDEVSENDRLLLGVPDAATSVGSEA
jgi:crotonobetainyl-CoA:carnitine CoA-transferase CaiB-like acyl-CoA transferase